MDDFNIIVSIDKFNRIGINDDLLYDIREDKKYFRKITNGHTVVMGRNTWESIPDKYKPLPNRTNVVISLNNYDDINNKYPNIFVYKSLNDFINNHNNKNKVFIIGGESIYKQSYNLLNIKNIYLTYIYDENNINIDNNLKNKFFDIKRNNKYNISYIYKIYTSNYKTTINDKKGKLICFFIKYTLK